MKKKVVELEISPRELRAIAKDFTGNLAWLNDMSEKERNVFLTEGEGCIFGSYDAKDGTQVDIKWYPKQKNGKFRL